MNVVIVVGQVTGPGRLVNTANGLADFIREDRSGATVTVLDLALLELEFCNGRPIGDYGTDTQQAVRRISEASAVIFASPVYRATYTGVLKNLLDILPIEALKHKPVGILVVGASPHHYLGVDSQLRFVLAWFGAVVAPTSVYLTGQDFSDGVLVQNGLDEVCALGRTVLSLTSTLANTSLGPDPLAARAAKKDAIAIQHNRRSKA